MQLRSSGLALGLLLATSMATAAHHEHAEHQGDPVIQVISTVVGGKNVFIPSTLVMAAGKPHTLSIFNTTDKPHGFSIPSLKIMEVLPDQVEHEVKLPALEAGIYPIHSHLHPAHRTATLLVVDD
jgi:heme/copper-type cytochrome/quinol oxidase subunit 2